MKKRQTDELFSTAGDPGRGEPLAARMRPRTLDEFVGQDHIVGPGRLLRRAIQKDQLSSLIFSGPPGSGKTTLARIIANTTSSRFITLNAVLAGVADIRLAIEEAKRHKELYSRRTILFVDEVHRWNKSQQDALLPWVENGTVLLIGATTENPFFEVNKALVSRSRVFLLSTLGEADLEKAARSALSDTERGYGAWKVSFESGALEHLVKTADGDARSLLNALELAVETSADPWPPAAGAEITVTMAAAEESIQRRAVLYDKDGDYHYDAISAFIKSIRGSDPDAALYWLARMVHAGEDPGYAFRRMLISAAEDIGLADPDGVRVVMACAEAFDRIGMPEGQFHLAQAALYLATAPKSNSTLGYFDALKAVEEESAQVPNHLKDAGRDAKGFGHGEGYAYPHAYRDHWTAQQYLPDSMKNRIFYQPGVLGQEGERRGLVLERREIQVAEAAQNMPEPGFASPDGNSVWSKSGERLAEWISRAEGGTGTRTALLRSALFDAAAPKRGDRILIYDARDGFLVWEALRRAPEGTVVALTGSEAEAEYIRRGAANLAELQKPVVLVLDLRSASPESLRNSVRAVEDFVTFDFILAIGLAIGYSPDSGSNDARSPLDVLCEGFPGARFLSVESPSDGGGRLSSIFRTAGAAGKTSFKADAGLISRFTDFEADFFSRRDSATSGKTAAEIEKIYRSAPIDNLMISARTISYQRNFSQRELELWFSRESPYGKALAASLGPDDARTLFEDIRSLAGPVEWPFEALVISGITGAQVAGT